LSSLGNLTEKSLQTVAKEILTGIVEIQTKMLKSHGSITAEEVIIDSHGTLKVTLLYSNFI